VARFDKVKNLDALIRAFARFIDGAPPVPARLVLVGDGPLRAELEAQARASGVADKVDFPGESADVPSWYGRFSVFVNCSHYEGMSNTLLEAMACGLPLAASAVRGNAEWLKDGENAAFFAPGDEEGLAGALRILAADPSARARMGRENRARVEREFSNATFLARYAALYRELLPAK
jgi:glycosyltransferase involved in cell wall biosynthesis